MKATFLTSSSGAVRNNYSTQLSPTSKLSRIGLTLALAATLLCGVSLMTAAQTLPLAGPKRPATVPADYVITPFGYFHPSCIKHLAKGDVVRQDENAIGHANGASDNMQECAFARYTADGEKVTGDEPAVQPPTIGHSWIEYAGVKTTTAYRAISSEWNVPPPPSKNDGQTVYLFNGLEDSKDVDTILQPVLGWNSDYGSAWGIASWNCCTKGTVYEASPAPVNSGDLILGYTVATCSPGTTTCSSWDVYTFDQTNGNTSELLLTSNFGQAFNWAFGGVLEVYNIVQCGDYPAGGRIDFFEQYLYDDNGVQIAKPAWKISNVSSGLTPQCGYGGKVPEQVILSY